MTNPGFIRLFSSPLMAFLVSAIIVSGSGYLIYRLGRDKDARFWKLLSVVAEVCVAVGLVGLAVFAGQMKISADHQLLEERVRVSQAALDERFRLAALEHCAPVTARPSAPYNPTVAKKELCAIASSFNGVTASAADWESAERSLREFGSKYPGCVENVFTRHSDCSDVVASAARLADEIRILDTHRQASRGDESMAAMLQAPSSWGLLLLAFLIAAIGVAIKCARAATDYLDTGKSG